MPRGSVGCKREIAPAAVGSGVCWECWRAAKVEGERAAKGSPGHGCARRELGHGAVHAGGGTSVVRRRAANSGIEGDEDDAAKGMRCGSQPAWEGG